ncbi:serine/threonine-protein phosphatase 2A regulatory subunit B [Nematocida minor]|uniref:serine/threonine-protein phosphatase 2A regulatory subunit B n=1 Tax=Nematocida minor TaxID=1912983 RepID=UPI00221E6346|nr:serine/threonine-protein phosphatase 2A regulatory subunit B [Nematocida minor]XP_051332115.1 serine/threonine-protein phosphatase 2A regulatory subunit B [Nematocida minor]KAI5188845.1 serine/threonine-protein phosphatase 2A regulatory subunit B [Nematocida minor]KAI5188949.1 serine/threonine-protein phosphatase 2A regulatory subunit B [Nematocida minor]
MLSNWKCRQTITAAPLDCYKSSSICADTLVLGRNKGFVEVYKIGPGLKKKIEYKSHAPCFDYLRSTEIAESVDSIDIVPSGTKEILVLSGNQKNIKLWNVHSSFIRADSMPHIVECCTDSSFSCDNPEEKPVENSSPSQRIEKIFACESKKKTRVKLEKEYMPENIYNIHSLSVSHTGESILMSDELTITFLNHRLENPWVALNLKPSKNEELSKVITTARFVQNSSSMFIYGTAGGTMHLHDLRDCSRGGNVLSINAPKRKDFYNEVVQPVADIQFISDNIIASRDLQYVVTNDIRSSNSLLQEYDVYPLVRKNITELYDSDEIFSKFKMAVSGNKVYTGSFNTVLAEIDTDTNVVSQVFLEEDLESATRIIEGMKVSCISLKDDCLVAAYSNQCYIFRSTTESA